MATTGRVNREAGRESSRATAHLLLGMITVAGCYASILLAPNFSVTHALVIGLGYVSLIFIAVTLLIGPLNLLWQRRNPVNIDLRRDVGFWAGLTSAIHVLLILWGEDFVSLIRYFFGQFSWFGFANYSGLIALGLILILMLISNDRSLRLLRGPRWKNLQRLNYLLFAFALAHTFGYEYFMRRGWGIANVVITLSFITLAAQTVGFVIYRTRQKQREQNAPTLSLE